MDGENPILEQHNPHPELDDVWDRYNERSNNCIRDRLDKGFTLPPLATQKRMEILKTILTLRTIGVLKAPT